jgi:hypothetical protein
MKNQKTRLTAKDLKPTRGVKTKIKAGMPALDAKGKDPAW